tara:strand:+ start:613 stop:1530 length:918 start_codon:yes stop_codon:yes gene_type:complete
MNIKKVELIQIPADKTPSIYHEKQDPSQIHLSRSSTQERHRSTLTGILYRSNKNTDVCVIIIHGTEGVFYEDLPGFLAPNLAENGYTSLSINLRNNGKEFATSNFEESSIDVKTIVDNVIKKLKFNKIVLIGHSLGSVISSHYIANNSVKELKGFGVFATAGDLPENTKNNYLGVETYNKRIKEAIESSKLKNGNKLFLMPFLDEKLPLLTTHNSFLNYRGAKSNAVITKWVKKIKLPILIVRSSLDVIEKKWSEKIKKNAINSKQCEFYEIKSKVKEPLEAHCFFGNELKTIEITLKWLKKLNL